MESSLFWDITPCSPLKVNWPFGETCRLHLQGRRISQARNQLESTWQAKLLRWRPHVPPKRQFNLHRCENLRFYKSSYRVGDWSFRNIAPNCNVISLYGLSARAWSTVLQQTTRARWQARQPFHIHAWRAQMTDLDIQNSPFSKTIFSTL
jgi:hypothetical protein